MKSADDIRRLLFEEYTNLTDDQKEAVTTNRRRVLVVAGAGSGKTEIMARKIAYWIGIEGIQKDKIVAFTFTEKAAKEMKFRIRLWMERISEPDEEVTLGGMYIGTIHGFCIQKLREYWPNKYHNYDILDEASRLALVQRAYYNILALNIYQEEYDQGMFSSINNFLKSYDLLHENDQFDIEIPDDPAPIALGEPEEFWCRRANLITDVGDSDLSRAFERSAARFYAYMRCRRFLDFSTSQSEFIRKLRSDAVVLNKIRNDITHLVVDEVQDINLVQKRIIDTIVGNEGKLIAVGDHRQSIFAWRGGRVDLLADMWSSINNEEDGIVVDLRENFRSTSRIIELANNWANTIGQVGEMVTPDMRHGREHRTDYDPVHLNIQRFEERNDEAIWIANTINQMVTDEHGARHDVNPDEERGIALPDIAILLRSSSDARHYMETLEENGIPAVFRAGPDLFSQPEVLLVISSLSVTAKLESYYGNPHNPKSLPCRVRDTLDCDPVPELVISNASQALRNTELPIADDLEERLILASKLIAEKIDPNGNPIQPEDIAKLNSDSLKRWLNKNGAIRRVFLQSLYHMILEEVGIENWDSENSRGSTALFHLGALSSLITEIESPGWISVSSYKYNIIALLQYGSENARTEEAPLLVSPNAVTISTIHSAKGLEFPVVFLADVNARRFPSSFARRQDTFPFGQDMNELLSVNQLSDNENYDSERRLMYVALTRAERYLSISASGPQRSRFFRSLQEMVGNVGGVVDPTEREMNNSIENIETQFNRDLRLTSSFSDLRYFIECPHDFYLRKVLGFAPTIDQAFGYGKGVHNLLRAIHSNPRDWAEIAEDEDRLKNKIENLIEQGLFYLRYTTGEPAANLINKGTEVVLEYIQTYLEELRQLDFEPEKEFETLIEDEQVLISGAIDLVRLDDPPRVTLVDFKSGDAKNESVTGLDKEEMELQIALYGDAAIRELEYEPEQGFVRYLGESEEDEKQMIVDLSDENISRARNRVQTLAQSIKSRNFFEGPRENYENRCERCDFNGFCGMEAAINYRQNN